MPRNILVPKDGNYEKLPWPEGYTVRQGDEVLYGQTGQVFRIAETNFYGDLYRTDIVDDTQHIFGEESLGDIYLPIAQELGHLSVQGPQDKA